MKKRAYRSIAVKDVDVAEVQSRLGSGTAWVGLDVSKHVLQAVARNAQGTCSVPGGSRNRVAFRGSWRSSRRWRPGGD